MPISFTGKELRTLQRSTKHVVCNNCIHSAFSFMGPSLVSCFDKSDLTVSFAAHHYCVRRWKARMIQLSFLQTALCFSAVGTGNEFSFKRSSAPQAKLTRQRVSHVDLHVDCFGMVEMDCLLTHTC